MNSHSVRETDDNPIQYGIPCFQKSAPADLSMGFGRTGGWLTALVSLCNGT